MSNENQMFVPSKKESSVRRKTGLVKPWPSERSIEAVHMYTDKKNPVFEGVSSARDDFLARQFDKFFLEQVII